jgi:hypothetical protein
MAKLAEPYMVHDHRQLAAKLLNGKWLIARHEHLGPDEDLPTWRDRLAAACTAMGVDADFILLARKDLTIVVNTAAPPTFDQVQDSIRAIEFHRFTEREIGPELLDKAG